MEAIELLQYLKDGMDTGYPPKHIINDAIEEIESLKESNKKLDAYITNYQGIKKRLDNAVTTLAVLQNENKQLVKTLEKYNKEIIELRKANQDLKNRSCSTCKYGRSFHFDKDIECMKLYDATQGLCFEKDFYCKNWESK